MGLQAFDENDGQEDIFQPDSMRVFEMLDGDINSQGLKIGHRAWLDLGSKEWESTTEAQKAAAYQIATGIKGWEPARLANMMLVKYKHMRQSTIDLTFKLLEEWSQQFPLPIEDVADATKLPVVINTKSKEEK